MYKALLPTILIAIGGGLWGAPGAVGAAILAVVLLAAWATRRWVYVTVPELETAVVYRTDSKTFARFLAPGRHWLMPFTERLGKPISTAAAMVKGQCVNAETMSGIPLTLDWSLSYKLNPLRIPIGSRPKLARSLPAKAGLIARNHVNNCIRHVVGDYPVDVLSEPGMVKRLEREVRQLAATRLADLGFELSRAMLGAIEMPTQVRAALTESYEQKVRTEHEAQSLARLHQVVSQFSEADMARLMELERIYKMGQNGVTMVYAPPFAASPTPQATRDGRRRARSVYAPVMPPDAAVTGLS
ncbi:MAG: hypothetical protein GY803_30330 [Chloroflexi bacterium]|nr:hypothetical protein [Chloroflexota bacterium]